MPENIITIDGRQLEFEAEETILDVARRNGIFIPTLCHIKGARPTGACRICVVAVEGARTLLPACATPAAPKMVVHTHSPSVIDARRVIIALLLQSGNHNCAIATNRAQDWTSFQQQVADYDQSADLCPAHSACNLQAYAYRYQVDTTGFVRAVTDYPMEMASPLIVRDFSRCILCGRCVEACNTIQVNNAIAHGFRGARAKIVAMGNDNLQRSDCVFCGECIQACPVAALVETKSRYKIRQWEARHVRTTCHYCGVGCQLDLHIKDDKIMKVTGVEDARPNQGRLCVKGRFGYDFVQSPDRLTVPMIRENGTLRDASWHEALDLVASKMQQIIRTDGPEAVAGICSAKSTNEALYLMQKLFRTGLGTNNLASPFAASGLNNPIAELEKARSIFLIGSDITEENPVAGTFVKRAAKSGCKLIVANSRPTKIATFAEIPLFLREGSESVLVSGIIQELISRGRSCSDSIREIAASFTMDKVSEATGLSEGQIRGAVDVLDADGPTMLVYGSKVASFARTFVRLQETLGNLGVECGGVNYLGDLNNSQGACDMGFLPAFLPGYQSVEDEKARSAFEDAWGTPLSGVPGLTFPQLIKNMAGLSSDKEKKIRFFYCVGENLAIARPAMPAITAALESVDFLVVQDILKNETLEHADVVLPAAAWSEETGTYTNCERRVSLMRRAVPSPGEAKPETWILTQLANRLGLHWEHETNQSVWEDEIIKIVPFLKGITYDRLEHGGICWALPDPASLGITGFADVKSPLRRPGWTSFNYHHRTLLEQCEGLLESIPHTKFMTAYEPPGDPEEVRQKFIDLLREEEKPEAKEEIDRILAEYKDHRGGLIPVLQQVQGILGFLPIRVQHYIALGLGMPSSDVFGVVSFYSFFTMVPRGKHIIRICLGTACFVKGSGKLLDILKRHLHVDVGQTTADREYSLDVVRCVGACGLAPVMVVDDETHGQMEPSQIIGIVEAVRGTK